MLPAARARGENFLVDPLQNETFRLRQRDQKRVAYGSAAIARTVREGAGQLELVADSCELLSGENGRIALAGGEQKGCAPTAGRANKIPFARAADAIMPMKP